MSYFGFLIIFLVIPILILSGLMWLDKRQGRRLSPQLGQWSPTIVLVAHIVVAVAYTTPWDNYLVANRIWWYDPDLVTGIVFGWVPIEEYTFFVLQPIFTGLWLLFVARRLSPVPEREISARPHPLRRTSTLLLFSLWLVSVAILIVNWLPGTYLALELVWAIPPIMLQMSFGADILWHHRRLVLWSLLPTTIYLSLADALAIASGTWTINPARSLQIYLGGVLPLEELLFFALTNILLVFGIVLVLARESHVRLQHEIQQTLAWRTELGQ